MEYVEFPKWKYHKTKEPRIVANAEAEQALGKGWEDSPVAFEQKPEPQPGPKASKDAK